MKKNYYVSIFTSVSLLTTACSRDDNLDTKNSKSERQAFIIEEAFPDTPKELVTLPSGIQVEKVDSIYILGGDIILTQAQVDSLSRPATRGAIITGVGKKWDYGIVFYRIATPDNHEKIQAAIQEWEAQTDLCFWEAVVPYNKDYIKFISGSGNWSKLGKVGGAQELCLYPDARSNTGTAIHEIGHAIGLFHEQCRTDRDNYITINWNNIKSDKQHNFRTYVESGYSGENINQFDFNSIMLYSSYIGDENFVHNPNIPVITKKDGSTFTGQRSHLSEGDITTVNSRYPNYKPSLICTYYGGRTEQLILNGGQPAGYSEYSTFVFMTKEPAKSDFRIQLTEHCLETSRDYDDVEWANNFYITIPAGSGSAIHEINDTYYLYDDYGWTHVSRKLEIHNDSILIMSNPNDIILES